MISACRRRFARVRQAPSFVASALVCLAIVCGGMFGRVHGRRDASVDSRSDVRHAINRNIGVRVSRIDRDADGRVDQFEYFERGALTRRETDRDFDGKIDLVEEFDPQTGERTRSEVDANRDGETDFVIVFAHGDAVATVSTPYAPALRGRHVTLRPVRSFSRDDGAVGVWTAGGLPRPAVEIAPLSSAPCVHEPFARPFLSVDLRGESPRGPPRSTT